MRKPKRNNRKHALRRLHAPERLELRTLLDASVVFNEIHYHPAGNDSSLEFIELENQMAIDMDISGWRLDSGVEFDFPEGTVVPGRGYLVIAADPDALAAASEFDGALGPFAGQLSNGGELLRLLNNNGRRMSIVDYRDDDPWPVGADGSGATLARMATDTDVERAANWAASIQLGGTPGAENFPDPDDQRPVEIPLVRVGDAARVLVPAQVGDVDPDWHGAAFDDSAAPGWMDATTGIGFDTTDGFNDAGLIDPQGDLEATMSGINSSALVRIPFDVEDPDSFDALALDVEYDDGFVAYLNGTEIARHNAPAGDLPFDASASDEIAAGYQDVVLRSIGEDVSPPVAYWRLGEQDGGEPAVNLGSGRSTLNGFYQNFDAAQPGLVDDSDTAANFNGIQNATGTIVSGAGLSSLEGGNPFLGDWTIEAWLVHDSMQTWSGVFSNNAGTTGSPLLTFISNTNQLGINGAGITANNVSIDLGADHFDKPIYSVITKTGGNAAGEANLSVYVNLDGTWLETATGTNEGWNLSAGDAYYIGRHWANAHQQHDGLIDEVAVYDRAISIEEIENHFLASGRTATNMLGDVAPAPPKVSAVVNVDLSDQLDLLAAGNNVLAIHGLNVDATDEDFLLRPELTATLAPATIDPSLGLVFSEIAAASDASFFVEIANPTESPIDTEGLILRSSSLLAADYLLPAASVEPGGWLAISQAELGFAVAEGDRLFLYTAAGEQLIDAATVDDRLRGRWADHDGAWLYPSSATPGAANAFNFQDAVVINEIMYHPNPQLATEEVNQERTLVDLSGEWRYDQSGVDLGTAWREVGFNDDAWSTGSAILSSEMSLSYTETVLQDAPLGYWRLGEQAGAATAVNLGTAGAMLDGNYQNFSGTGDGLVGDNDTAADFDGVQSADGTHIVGMGLNSLPGGNPFAGDWSIEAWLVHDSTQQWSGIFSNNAGTTGSPLLTFIDNTNQLGINAAGISPSNVSVDLGPDHFGKPIYAVITKTGGNAAGQSAIAVNVNVDGRWLEPASGTTTWNVTSGDGFYIGRHWASGTQMHDGLLDEVAIYDYALSEDQVAAHYNAARLEIETPLAEDVPTQYFRTTFDFAGDPAQATELVLDSIIDDGAVFYLNGQEIYRRNMPDGPIEFLTSAASEIDVPRAEGSISIPAGLLIQGENVLAVEVHQFVGGEGDVTFGSSLDVSLRLSDARPFVESTLEWLELHNRDDEPVDLAGWSLADAVEFSFAPGTTIEPGGFLVVAKDAAAMATLHPDITILGNYSGSLSNESDRILLVDAAGNPADEVEYFDSGRWPQAAYGGGASLELSDPAADNSRPEAWRASDEAANSEWRTFTFRDTASADVGPVIWNEFILGLLDTGEVLIDDVSVIEDPDGAARQLIQNPDVLESLIVSGAAGRLLVPGQAGDLDANWYERLFDDSAAPGWFDVQTGVGFDTSGSSLVAELISAEGDVAAQMAQQNASAFLRIPFQVDDPADFDQLRLILDYDDGYVAYLNGIEIDRQNAPDDPLAFNSTATDVASGGTLPNVQGLLLWLDASDPSTVLDASGNPADNPEFAGTVATWIDKSDANGNDLPDDNNAQAASAPVYVVDGGVDGTSPVLTFTNDRFLTPLSVADSFTVFAVARENDRHIGGIVGHQTAGNGDVQFGDVFGSEDWANGLWSPWSASHAAYGNPLAAVDQDYNILSLTVDGAEPTTDWTVLENGVGGLVEVQTDFATVNAQIRDLQIGAGNGAREFWDGDIAEILVFDHALNAAESDAVGFYLAEKYGIATTFGGGASESFGHQETDVSQHLDVLASGENVLAIQGLNIDPADADFLVLPQLVARKSPVIAPESFPAIDRWRVIGNHQAQVVVDPDDPENYVLHLTATGPTEHQHNHAETTFLNNTPITNGTEYEISFRAKWLSGSSQLNGRFYLSRVAETFLLDVPDRNGTPGAPNSTRTDNIGPTYANLQHGPVVPAAFEEIQVQVESEDPDGVSSMTLWWRIENGDWNSVAMTAADGATYAGTIPGQPSATVLQFYVEGQDSLGANSTFPAAGSDSRALIKVQDGQGAARPIDTFRLVMATAEAAAMFDGTQLMSNQFIGATVVVNESEVYYDVGVRLKGSPFGRSNANLQRSYRIDFHPDRPFRGVYESIALDGSGRSPLVNNGQDEILVHQLMNHAGGYVTRYDDLAHLIAPQSRQNGPVILQLASYGNDFLDERFDNGSDGNLFEFEIINHATQTVDGDPESLKTIPPPAQVGTDIRNLGDDKENYRWTSLRKNNRDRDDYSRIIEMAQAFDLVGAALDEASQEILDVDWWMRNFAMTSLVGQSDVYTFGAQHNIWLYVRPEDNKVLVFPWDVDSVFARGTNASLFGSGNLSKIIQLPANLRLLYGHFHDIINTTFNEAYIASWAEHLGSLVGQDYSPHVDYIRDRGAFVLSQLPAEVRFAITTPGPLDAGQASVATLAGDGWVNVREIRRAGSNSPLDVTWTDLDSWSLDVSLDVGENEVVLEAYDFQGNLIGSDTILVTTASENPYLDYLQVSELMYHPADPSPAEQDAGFFEADAFEFVELYNSSTDVTLDLTGVRIVEGPSSPFAFAEGDVTSLAPGEYVLVVADARAFRARYGEGLNDRIAGEYLGGLSNGGEDVLVVDPGGAEIHNFTYRDSHPWPAVADGYGFSIVLKQPDSAPDHALGENWRGSGLLGGSPGAADLATQPSIVINEILTHTDAPDVDRIELFNPTNEPVPVGGWFLTDDVDLPQQYAIPAGTVIPAGGYVTLDEDDDADPLTDPGPGFFGSAFSLSSLGEELYLFSGDGTDLTGHTDSVAFGAALLGESFGRWPNGAGELYPMRDATFGQANRGPRIGPLTISEIMYHPPDPSIEGITSLDLEFIEIHNPTTTTEDLTGWEINGLGYAFPSGRTIGPGETLVVLPFDPTLTVENAAKIAAFQSIYGVDVTNGDVFLGPFGGTLDNRGERITLLRADEPPLEMPGVVPLVIEERVDYEPLAPWPAESDGGGLSLTRVSSQLWSNDPTSWTAAVPSPGNFDNFLSTFQVVDVTATGSGAQIRFNGDIDLTLLNLYDGPDAAVDLPDVSLVGDTGGPVAGSLIWNAPTRTLHFVATGGPLPADRYTLQLAGNANGLVDTLGQPLDGDADGTPGGDLTESFVVEESTERVIGLPDFVRGPEQAVELPTSSSGIPIWIDDGEGVTSVALSLQFDPVLLNVTDAALSDTVPVNWTIAANLSTPGVVTIEASGPEALSGGRASLFSLQAVVPPAAPFGAAGMLSFESVLLNDGAIDARGDDAIHLTAFLGDATGNGDYSGLDASWIARVAVGLDTGFDVFDHIDPVIIGDVTSNGSLSALDASFVARKAVGLDQPEIPDLPEPAPAPLALGLRDMVGPSTDEDSPDWLDTLWDIARRATSPRNEDSWTASIARRTADEQLQLHLHARSVDEAHKELPKLGAKSPMSSAPESRSRLASTRSLPPLSAEAVDDVLSDDFVDNDIESML